MSKVNDGGPAFPRPETEQNSAQRGMSLLDWFAGQALVGEVASYSTMASVQAARKACEERGLTPVQNAAFNAYRLADAMLAERDKKSAE